MGTGGDAGLLVVLGGGGRLYREYVLASLTSRRVWLFDDEGIDWQVPYLAGHSAAPQLRAARLTANIDGLVRQINQLAVSHRIAGVFTYEEALVVPAARLAEKLGLPGLTETGAENCRDKWRTREVLTEASVPQPRFAYATDCAAALRAAELIGYPVVVKPRGMGGSVGVVRAHCPDAVETAFATALAASRVGNTRHGGGALVEEMVEGPEISVDGAVQDGDYRSMFVARKTVCFEPYFEECGHIVDADDPLLADEELLAVLRTAHRALGVRDGVTHTEVKLSANGPVIIEVNARLGGDLIPLLGKLATGIDAAGVAADMATGRPARWRADRRGSAGIHFCYPPADGVLRGVRLPGPADAPGLVRAAQMAPDGTLLRLPPRGYLSRAAFVVCRAPDPAGCAAALRDAASRTHLDLDAV
jgi:biotin carboxylase